MPLEKKTSSSQSKMYRILSYGIIVKKRWEKTDLYHHVKYFILFIRVCENGLWKCMLASNKLWVLPTSQLMAYLCDNYMQGKKINLFPFELYLCHSGFFFPPSNYWKSPCVIILLRKKINLQIVLRDSRDCSSVLNLFLTLTFIFP